MRADRRVDAAGPAEPRGADHFLVQRLAHAMQALELVLAGVEIRAGHGEDRRQGLRVVSGELREYRVRRVQQLAGAGEVGDVRMGLAGEHREVVQPVHLRPLDLAVPVRALDQAHHEPPPGPAGEVHQVVDGGRAALAVGLQHEADAVPSGQRRVERQRLQQVERRFEAVRLLGVDVEADAIALGAKGQAPHPGQQLVHHPLPLGAAVTRVQGGELDRDARPLDDAAPGGGFTDGGDGALVLRQVTRRVRRRGRRLAEHVVRVAEAARLHPAAVGQGLRDGLAGDELLTHQAHGHIDALADDRLAAAGNEPGQRG